MTSISISPSIIFCKSILSYTYCAFCRVLRRFLWCLGHKEQVSVETSRLSTHCMVAYSCTLIPECPSCVSELCWGAHWNVALVIQARCCGLSTTKTAFFCGEVFLSWCLKVICVWVVLYPGGMLLVSDTLVFGHPLTLLLWHPWESELPGKSAYRQRPQIERGNKEGEWDVKFFHRV